MPKETIIIQKSSGLVGCSVFTSVGVRLEVLFNPAIRRHSLVQVRSSVDPANGDWLVVGLSHQLDAQVPGGKWFSTLDCYNPAEPTALSH